LEKAQFGDCRHINVEGSSLFDVVVVKKC